MSFHLKFLATLVRREITTEEFTDCWLQLTSAYAVWSDLLDVKLAPWSEETDENGQRKRTISYTLSINYGFGQKICPSTEIQVFIFRPPDIVVGRLKFYIDPTSIFFCLRFTFVTYPPSSLNGTQTPKPAICLQVLAISKCMSKI